MRISSLCCTTLTAVCLLCGQLLISVDSVRADDAAPVASDLVELALAIPEAVADVEQADARLPFVTQLSEAGRAPASQVDDLRRQRETAIRKLKLLRAIIHAELKVTQLRFEVFVSRRQRSTGGSPDEIAAAEERVRVLTVLKEACAAPEKSDEQAVSQKVDLPPLEPMLIRIGLLAETDSP